MTEDNIVKIVTDSSGYVNYPTEQDCGSQISTPRTLLSHGQDGLSIPQSAADDLRDALRSVYPELADRPFTYTRMCW